MRRKLLEKGKHLTLTKTLELAATFETIQQQFEAMKVNDGEIESMNFHTKENHLVRWGSPAMAKQLRNATGAIELDILAVTPNTQQEAKHATNVKERSLCWQMQDKIATKITADALRESEKQI